MCIFLFIYLVAALQQRFSSHGYKSDFEIGPPASFNQLPHPEGDWTENHQKKQTKYNSVLGGAAVFFAGTLLYVSIKCSHWIHFAIIKRTIDYNPLFLSHFSSQNLELSSSTQLYQTLTNKLPKITSPYLVEHCIQRVRMNSWNKVVMKNKEKKPNMF